VRRILDGTVANTGTAGVLARRGSLSVWSGAMEREPQEGMERVGAFEMHVTIGTPTAGRDERRERRVEALTAWLANQWQNETARDGAHDIAA
jgi:hypothetical protein